jgi:hypothetical protein
VADDDSKQQILVSLRNQLVQSRQQQSRLRDALTRVLSLLDEAQTTRSGTSAG